MDLRWELIVEVKFFDDQVEIVDKGVLDKFFDRVVELVGDLFFRVTIFKSKEPKVKLFHSCIDKRLERLVTGEHDTDGTGQEGEEGKTNKFNTH